MPYDDEKLLDIVNGHGFLLQQAVEHTVQERKNARDVWKVVSTEHFWQHSSSGKSGYADLLIANEGRILAVVECKRVKEDTPWIFLTPRTRPREVEPPISNISNLHWTYRVPDTNRSGWYSFFQGPTTLSAQFCIVVGQNNDRPMLERVAGELMYAVEAIGAQQLRLRDSDNGAHFLLPLIVTNASLYSCAYTIDAIDKVNGRLQPDATQLSPIHFIRFEKVFTETPWNDERVHRLVDIELHQRQTVMVVNSEYFVQFLSECSVSGPVDPNRMNTWPWQLTF